jgi:hypothetical protein
VKGAQVAALSSHNHASRVMRTRYGSFASLEDDMVWFRSDLLTPSERSRRIRIPAHWSAALARHEPRVASVLKTPTDRPESVALGGHEPPRNLIVERLDIRIHHQVDKLGEGGLGTPAEHPPRLARVAS